MRARDAILFLVGAALIPGGAAAQERCAALLDARCLRVIGAGSTPAPGGDCDAQLAAYRDCLAGVAATTPTGVVTPPRAGCTDATALSLWDDAKTENDCLGYQTFLDACPAAPQARFASARLQRLGCGGEAAAPSPASAPAPAPVIPVAPPPADRTALYRDSQAELKRLGFYGAAIDGDWGPGSQRAMRTFQRRAGLSVDGQPSEQALERLKQASAADFAPVAPETAAAAPWIGMKIQDVTEEIARSLGLGGPAGALVVDFAPNSPARLGGLRQGDVVITFDAVAVGRARDVARLVKARKVGQRVPVVAYRSGERITLWVTLGAAP